MRGAAQGLGNALLAFSGAALLTPAPHIEQVPQVTPAAPGFPTYTQTPRDQTQSAELARTYEALFGRVATRLGPTNPRWSTFTGELKPELISNAISTADAGLPFTFCDMLRRAVEQDAHLAGCVLQAFSAIIAKRDAIDPPPSLVRDPVAVSVAHWLRAVREQVEDFDGARFALLWAEGQGYSSAENIFGWRRVTWYREDGKRISRQYLVPVKLEIIEGRSFRFDTETDQPLLWLQGGYDSLPPGKFIFHAAHGISSIRERRGFGRSVLFLHAIKQWCVRDLAIYLHLYGLNQAIISYDSKTFQPPEAKRIASELIEQLGQGGIPLVPADIFKLTFEAPPAASALVHTQAANWLNDEQTKAVTAGGPLQMSSTTGGSVGLGDVHAEGAYSAQVLRAQNLCDSIRRDLWWPTLQLNQYRLLEDLADLPNVSITLEDIRSSLPIYTPQIDRTTDPEKKQRVLSQAMKDGCPVSLTQYRAELQIDAPKDTADTLKGVGVPIPSSGAVVSAVDASEGVIAPNPNDPNGVLDAGPAAAAPNTTGPSAQEPKQEADTKAPKLELTSTDVGAIVTVDQALHSMGLPPRQDGDGALTIAEFKAKHSGVIADAESASDGKDAPTVAPPPLSPSKSGRGSTAAPPKE